MKNILVLIGIAIFVSTGTVEAKERQFSVYGFDAVRVTGNVEVSIETGKGPSAVAEADTRRTLDRIYLQKSGNELVISVREQPNRANRFSQEPPIMLRLTANRLAKITHLGSGNVTLDQLEGRNTSVRVGGFGSLAIGKVDADQLEISMSGGGELTVGGESRTARVSLMGSSKLDASTLLVDTLDLSQRGPASTRISVDRQAKISNSGNGAINVSGRPDCQVRSVGSAVIICNPDR